MFESEGEIVDVYLPKDFYSGEQRGFGFVEYKTEENAERAVNKVPYSFDFGAPAYAVEVK